MMTRDMGARGLLIYCSDYKCSHPVRMGGDRWPDDMRLSDIEQRLVCSACERAAGFQLDKMPKGDGISLALICSHRLLGAP
jgi:hypothetical protein